MEEGNKQEEEEEEEEGDMEEEGERCVVYSMAIPQWPWQL